MEITNPIARIEDQLFKVVEHQLIPNTNDGNFENPTVRGLYKATGGQPLGVVGSNFSVTQPLELFNAFTKCFGNLTSIDVDTMEYQETRGGSKVRFRVLVDKFGFTNAAKIGDAMQTYATLTTGYDGNTKTSLSLETHRLICLNGMTVRGTSANVSFKNVDKNKESIKKLCNTFGNVVGKTNDIKKWIKYLNTVDVTEFQVQKVIKQSFGFNRKDAEISKARLATLDDIENSIALEISRTGGNLWGLLNGITHYTNHGGRKKSDLTDYVYQAGGATINDRAQKAISELVG